VGRKIAIGGAIVAAVIGGYLLAKTHFRSPFGPADASAVKHTPLEFLYLDNTRVQAYLAELDHGTFAEQNLRHKLVNKQEGGVGSGGAKVAASSEAEDFVERVVTPTAASEFVELNDLLSPREFAVAKFGEDVRGAMREGEFVVFRTHALRPPIYLNPYLAVKQAGTLSALFPMPSRHPAQRAVVERRREVSRQFKRQVGQDPRVVFALQAQNSEEVQKAKYLLPMSVGDLADERSLIKFGGGEFTVIGKIVRIFPGKGTAELKSGVLGRHDEELAYVDSPTRETWEHPLEHAPGELICRTSPRCVREVERRRKPNGEGFRPKEVGAKRQAAIRKTRRRMLKKLHNQTEIGKEGAVILPIAIYK
jgi:hypothetical protein